MKTFVRRFAAAALAALLGVSMVACGGDTGKSGGKSSGGRYPYGNHKGTSLKIAVDYSYYTLDLFVGMVNEFAKSTGAAVQVANYAGTYGQSTDSDIESGELADVFMTKGYVSRKFKDYALDLSDEDFSADYTDVAKKLVTAGDGKIYEFALSHDMSGILMNTEVLDAAGVDPASIATWDDFLAACDTLKSKDIIPIGSVPGPAILSDISGSFLTYEGEAFDVGDKISDGSWDWGEYRQVLSFWQRCLRDGYLFTDASTMEDIEKYRRFAGGECAFLIGESNAGASMARSYAGGDDKFLLAPYPASKEGGERALCISDGDAFAINKDSKSIDCAKAFLRFLHDSDDSARLVRNTETVPALRTMKGARDLDGAKVLTKTVSCFGKSGMTYRNRWHKEYLPGGMYQAMSSAARTLFSSYDDDAAVDSLTVDLAAQFKSSYSKKVVMEENDTPAFTGANNVFTGENLSYLWQIADGLIIEGPEGDRKVADTVALSGETTLFIGDDFLDAREYWTNFYDESFAGKDVIAAGIKGAEADDWRFYLGRVLAAFGDVGPKNIVFNVGTNDYSHNEGEVTGASKVDISVTRRHVIDLIETAHKLAPNAKIYWYDITYRRAMSKDSDVDIDEINNVVREWIDRPEQDYVTCVEISRRVPLSLLRDDGLIPSLTAYKTFVTALKDAGCEISDRTAK